MGDTSRWFSSELALDFLVHRRRAAPRVAASLRPPSERGDRLPDPDFGEALSHGAGAAAPGQPGRRWSGVRKRRKGIWRCCPRYSGEPRTAEVTLSPAGRVGLHSADCTACVFPAHGWSSLAAQTLRLRGTRRSHVTRRALGVPGRTSLPLGVAVLHSFPQRQVLFRLSAKVKKGQS